MFLINLALNIFSKLIFYKYQRDETRTISIQNKILIKLIKTNQNCLFGKRHNFYKINSYSDYSKLVPVRNYEGIRSYIEKIKNGEKNILTKNKIIYLSKTSGTTSGIKYIPITKNTMKNMVNSTRDAILLYIHKTKKTSFAKGKFIFIQGCTKLTNVNSIKLGRLSGIVAHHTPFYLKSKVLPSINTNDIEDWERKITNIIEETKNQNMTLISGIPPWVIMYFEKLLSKTGEENISNLFKNFSLFITGGVDYTPYKNKIDKLIGRHTDIIETYPASEGFFAFKEHHSEKGLRLITNKGIFYEFIEDKDIHKNKPKRISIKDIEIGKKYALIVSTDAGLWAYDTGDIISFVSKDPHRIVFCGRTSHFISSFGEHVISSEVDFAMSEAINKFNLDINEFTVAPQVNPSEGKPYHEWFIEFNNLPSQIDKVAEEIDNSLQSKNIYYADLIKNKIIRPLIIRIVPKNTFNLYMKSIGKLGGQNKVPRVQNNRKIADFINKIS